MKKTLFLTFLLSCTMVLAGCKGNNIDNISGSSISDSVNQEPVMVTFSELVIDLSNPENVVEEADPTEKSEVFDSAGNKLSDTQWLLNSKFSKSYIASLPLGEHTFEYKSETKYGTIKIVITNAVAPKYLFSFDVEDLLKYEDAPLLPLLVKDQDSYQPNYNVEYTLYEIQGETKTSIPVDLAVGLEGYTADLQPGDYQWLATATLEEENYQFSVDFKKESFDEYLERKKDVFLYDEGRAVYVKNTNGQYQIDTIVQEFYTYSIPNDIVNSAIKEGKRFGFRIIMSEPTKTHLWITNGYWGSQAEKLTYAFSGNPAEKETYSFTNYIDEDGNYVYETVTDLKAEQFAKNETLDFYTSQFNASKEDSDTWQSISGRVEIWFE